MDGRTDGWMNGRMDGQMDGRMDGWSKKDESSVVIARPIRQLRASCWTFRWFNQRENVKFKAKVSGTESR